MQIVGMTVEYDVATVPAFVTIVLVVQRLVNWHNVDARLTRLRRDFGWEGLPAYSPLERMK